MTTIPFTIDLSTYRKERVCPVGKGWGRLQNPQETDPKKQIWLAGRLRAPVSVVVHATHGNVNSTFENEARYLMTSPDVGAHYLIGRKGQIAQIADDYTVMWHAGAVRFPDFDNPDAIGVEMHAATSQEILTIMRDALMYLCGVLINRWNIRPDMIDTHRNVSSRLPNGGARKSDPAKWSQVDFLDWRRVELHG